MSFFNWDWISRPKVTPPEDEAQSTAPIGSEFARAQTARDAGQVLSVSELTRCIRGVLEAEDLFSDLWVRGEISNLTKHSSGHTYFSMKDEAALIRCVIWNSSARRIRFDLADGMGVIVRGRITLYEKQGQYQLVVGEVTPDGVGSLYTAYEQLKSRLQAEGLFDSARKKPIPRFPRKIAVLTSPTAAALQDMVTIARRRFPGINILLIPTLMQGADAEASVVESLRTADSLRDIDVIILGRGGGSIEDLWTFNTEAVVRAVCSCGTPVVSAIGHETDYTLADFAADLRAPTPSAAAELVVPDREELAKRVQGFLDALQSAMESSVTARTARLDALLRSRCFARPEEMLQERWQSLDLLAGRLANSMERLVSRSDARLQAVAAKLDALSPLRVLSRGYSVVRRVRDGLVVKSVCDVAPGETTETLVSDGGLISEVKEIREGRD